MTVAPFVLAAMALLAEGRDHAALGGTIARYVDASAPLFAGDDDKRRTAAFLVAISFRESSLRNDVIGDKGTSHCAFQVHLPNGQKTLEGWSGDELRADPAKCITTAVRILRDSMRWCPAFPVAVYVGGPKGCEAERAQRISRDRTHITARLLRDVKAP